MEPPYIIHGNSLELMVGTKWEDINAPNKDNQVGLARPSGIRLSL